MRIKWVNIHKVLRERLASGRFQYMFPGTSLWAIKIVADNNLAFLNIFLYLCLSLPLSALSSGRSYWRAYRGPLGKECIMYDLGLFCLLLLHSKITFFPARDKENNWKQVVEADAGYYLKRTASFPSLNSQSESSKEEKVDRKIQASSGNLEPSTVPLGPFSGLESRDLPGWPGYT